MGTFMWHVRKYMPATPYEVILSSLKMYTRILRNKTAIECWNILKYVIESISDQFEKNKENGIERNTCQKKLLEK